jgi:hypothetical protein
LCVDLSTRENATVERILSENRGEVEGDGEGTLSKPRVQQGKKESDEVIMKRLEERYALKKPAPPKLVGHEP